jgi:Cd2+/Zn2+-exporting ATPase
VFAVQQVQFAPGTDPAQLLRLVGALETKFTYTIARAVVAHVGQAAAGIVVENVVEIAGHGLRGRVHVLAANTKLLTKFSVAYPTEVDQVVDNIVVAAVDGMYAIHFNGGLNRPLKSDRGR